MIVRPRGSRQLAAIIVVAVAAAAAVAGCSSSEPAVTTAPSSVAATPARGESDESLQASEAALAAYNGFRQAQVAAAASGDVTGGGLPTYTAAPLLTELKLDLLQKQKQGLVAKGNPRWSPQVVKMNLAEQPASVEIEDCFDQTGWDVIRKDTGKSVVVPGQTTRYLVVAKAVLYDDGRWLVSSARAERQRPC